MISAIVLAGGTSSRFGEPKPLAIVGDRPLLEHVLDSVRHSQVGQIVVVLGHEAERVHQAVALDGATVVLNRDYAAGMSTSIRAGLGALDPRSEAFLVVLGDQPFISPATLDVLIDQRSRSGAKILIPTFRGFRGNPVLVDRSLSAAVMSLSGDVGCRAIFGDHGDEILEVPVNDPGVLLDLDTKEDLERARQALERGTSLESLAEAHLPNVHVHEHGARTRDRTRVRSRVDVLALAGELRSRDAPFALATVVRVVRPTSGKPGFKAIVRPNRELTGWVGGSCAESVVIAESLAAMRDGRPRLLRLSRDAGLGPSQEGVVEYVMECHSGGVMDIYIEPNVPKARLLIVGDSPVAEALAALGRLMDYRVIVAASTANRDAFPEADEVVSDLRRLADLATEDTYAVLATMGKYDEAGLRALVASPAAYVGLVASRKRAAALISELRREGARTAFLDRIRNPAGLDLAAHTPEEIALSIMAEITKVRRSGVPREVPVVEAAPAPAEAALAIDVVCGMEVDPETPLRAEHQGTMYYFCSTGCRSRFLESPEDFVA